MLPIKTLLPELSRKEVDFIKTHISDDVSKLVLQGSSDESLDFKKIVGQIHARQKAAKKLPEWNANELIIFPASLSVEQSSSEATAQYKASLVSGNRLVDITGGMGVDFYYMSRKFERADYFEMQESVALTAAHNFAVLGAGNMITHASDSLAALAQGGIQADWIYTDPARRNSSNQKVVVLSDCTPDIVKNLDLLFDSAPRVLLKTSPLLDINLAVSQLTHVKEVHVIGHEQECKELLFILDKSKVWDRPEIKAVILDCTGTILHQLTFTRQHEASVIAHFSNPQAYLYEPHPAILKAGAFKTIADHLNVNKLASNSHLYTSENLLTDFPGRTFEIIAVSRPDLRDVKSHVTDGRANLTIRNFPGNIQDLRKKLRLKDGGDLYLFATTLSDKSKVVIITKKVVR
jgi:hypothetical protein